VRQITLPLTDIDLSKFVFGTANIIRAGTYKQRCYLLEEAVSQGFSHFDTAPYYGFGMAERDLAPVLKRNPSLTFTTKVGLYPPGNDSQSFYQIMGRKLIGRLVTPLSRPSIDFTIDRARVSLEGSLRRTGRETIDIYLLHEPHLQLLNVDEWRIWMEKCVAAGKIGTFGIAADSQNLEPFLQNANTLCPIVQTLDSLEMRQADVLKRYGRPFQITYGYISGSKKAGSANSIATVLEMAIGRNPHGAIVVSTTKPHRIAQYRSVAERLS